MSTGKKFSGYSVFAGCLLLMIFPGGLLSYTSGLFMYPICAEYNFSITSYSLSTVVAAAVNALVSAFFVQYLARGKRGQMKWLMLIAAIITCGGFALISRCTQLWQFIAMAGVWSLGYNMLCYVPVGMMMTNWFVKKCALMTGIAFAGGNLGGAIFNTVISQIMANQGWRSAYVFGGAVCFIAIVIAIVLIKRSPGEYGQTAYGAEAAAIGEPGIDEAKAWQGIDKKTAVKTPALYLVCAATFLTGIYAAGVCNHVVTFLCTGSWEITAAGFVMTVFTLFGIIGNSAGGGVIEKIGLKRSIAVGAAFIIIALICLTMANKVKALAYAWCAFQGIASFMAMLTPSLAVSEVFGTKAYTAIYGIAYSCYLIGCAISTTVVAFLAERTSYTTSWIAIMIVVALLAILYLSALKEGKKLRERYPG